MRGQLVQLMFQDHIVITIGSASCSFIIYTLGLILLLSGDSTIFLSVIFASAANQIVHKVKLQRVF